MILKSILTIKLQFIMLKINQLILKRKKKEHIDIWVHYNRKLKYIIKIQPR